MKLSTVFWERLANPTFHSYPNTGKSSIINTLRKKQVCTTAPIPGETKVWQYITLTRRIYLIDCPGVVPPNPNDTPEQILLRGVVRIEAVENPAQYVQTALGMCQRRHIDRTYELRDWQTADEFLELMARKTGKLLKGGEADMDAVAKMVLNDFLRGKIPWYVAPPKREIKEGEAAVDEKIEGRKGRLGEMAGLVGKKRKIDDVANEGINGETPVGDATVAGAALDEENDDDDDDSEDDEFNGFEDGGLVVGPDAIGNLDGFAVEDEDEDEDSEEDEADINSEDDDAADDDAKTLIQEDDESDVEDELRAEQLGADPPKKRRRKG
jgi:nuclear GTP-binding protein